MPNSSYFLYFSDQNILLERLSTEPIDVSYVQANQTCVDQSIYFRQGRVLYYFSYDQKAGLWQSSRNKTIFDSEGYYPFSHYPMYLSNHLGKQAVLIARTKKGVDFYHALDDSISLERLAQDRRFDDLSGWNTPDAVIKFGYFYPNTTVIGVLTRHPKKGDIKFYLVDALSVYTNKRYLLWNLNGVQPLLHDAEWQENETKFILADIRQRGQQDIVLHTKQSISFYEFKEENRHNSLFYVLSPLLKASIVAKPVAESVADERVLFAKITDRSYQDLLLFNTNGLFLYQYQPSQKNYSLLAHTGAFSETQGWKPKYTASLQTMDVNQDGRDDLIFTGQRGLDIFSFNESNFQWFSLLDQSRLTPSERYSQVITVLPPCQPVRANPTLFTQSQGKLQWAEIIPSDKPLSFIKNETLLDTPTKTEPSLHIPERKNISIPEIASLILSDEKYHRRWANQWESTLFENAIDIPSAQVHFTLPLVNIDLASGLTIPLAFSYNSQTSSSSSNALLGIGWSTTLIQEMIRVEDQGSLYLEDQHYTLMVSGRMQRLQYIGSDAFNSDKLIFESTELPDIKIYYERCYQRWVIDTGETRCIYGQANASDQVTAIQWRLAWPHWRGLGCDAASQERVPVAWYLVERHIKRSNQTLYYDYETVNRTVPNGKDFTESIVLKTMTDQQGTTLNLEYGNKSSDEYTVEPIPDKAGLIHCPGIQRRYLRGYRLDTPTYQQNLNFNYEVRDKRRLLTCIEQKFRSGQHEKLLQFRYETQLEQLLLVEAISPQNMIVQFHYQGVKVAPAPEIKHWISPKKGSLAVNQGANYTVVSHEGNQEEIVLQIFNSEVTDILATTTVHPKQPLDQRSGVNKNYLIYLAQDFFSLILYTQAAQEMYLFHRHQGNFTTEPTYYEWSKAALIRMSESFIGVVEAGQGTVTVIDWNKKEQRWRNSSLSTPIPHASPQSIERFTVYGRFFAVYDDKNLWLGYLDVQSGWRTKLLKSDLIGLATLDRQTIARFELAQDMQEQLLTALKHNGLQMLNNFIQLSALELKNAQLLTQVHLFLLDKDFNIVKTHTDKIEREKIRELARNHEGEDDVYQLGYVEEGGRFKVRIKAFFSGKIAEWSKTANKNHVEDKLKEYNDAKELKKFFNHTLLFAWESLYQVNMSPQGVFCGNDTLLRITGAEWEKLTLPLKKGAISIDVSEYFVLKQRDKKSSFKLYKRIDKDNSYELIRDLGIQDASKLLPIYPHALAFQTDTYEVGLLLFKGKMVTFQSISDAQLLGVNAYGLVTLKKLLLADWIGQVDGKPEALLIQPLTRFLPHSLQPTIREVVFDDQITQRRTGFSYEVDSSLNTENIAVQTKKVKVIPGANKALSGWREETWRYDPIKKEITHEQQFFDTQGKAIQVPKKNKKNATPLSEAASQATSSKSQLWDRNGQHIIADLPPHLLADEEVGYYGFESYEVNQIGKIFENSTLPEKVWQFNEKNIVKRGFAFTGENYLHLDGTKESNNTYLEGVFKPHRQDTTYLASCWLRCSQAIELNQAVPFFKGIIFTDKGEEILGILSRVKFQSGDWSYLELLVDLPFIKTIHQEIVTQEMTANVTESSSTITPPFNETEVLLSIVLRVGAATNISVDLDHIRFSPLDSAFPVSVYHPVTNQPTAIIQANGLLTRTFYNNFQQAIAILKEQGQLEFVSVESKIGYLFPLPEGIEKTQLPSRVTFQPESGFYEEFDAFALRSRWIVKEPETWKIAPGQLHHQASHWNQIAADSRLLDGTSLALRYEIAFLSSSASLRWHWQGGYVELTRQGMSSTLSCPSCHNKSIKGLPTQGEWILFVEKNRLWVWSEGVLLFDQAWSAGNAQSLKPWTRLILEARGHVAIKDLCLMNNPSVQLEYFNRFGEKTQVVTLKDTKTVQVFETLYDNLGRPAITSKVTALTRTSNQPLLTYYPDFITNDHPPHPNSVWKTDYLAGEVNRLNPHDRGFAYQRVTYAPNPLHEEQAIGLPGRDFSVAGPYAKRFSQQAHINFLTDLFPSDQGYRQHVETQPNGRKQVEIFDKNNNRVALYQHVPGYDHQLSTYEYDENNRLIKVLPPLYHEKVHSRLKTGEQHLSEQERYWQRLGTHFVYHKNGHLLHKTTPDSGTITFTYTSDEQIKFMVFGSNQIEKVIYLDYNEYGQLYRTGYLNPPLNQSELLHHVNSTAELPGAQDYQQFYYAADHAEPILRSRIKRLVTFNEEKPFLEEFHFNADHQVEVKGILSMLAAIEKQYVAGRLQALSYPIIIDGKPFKLNYQYNKQGQLASLGTDDNPGYYAKFNYHPGGQLLSEEHRYDSSQHRFVRHYHYNSPGFLKKITDPFLTEDLSYTEGGYGQAGYGGGMVMQTAFNASWLKDADPRFFMIDNEAFADAQWVTPEQSKRCVQALANEGYLDTMKRPIKLYSPGELNTLPLTCSDGAVGYQLAQTLAERYFPVYGHRYAYGNYQELTKGKYFVGDPKEILGSLQPTTFADEIPGLTYTQSESIWHALHQADYFNQDKRQGDLNAIYGAPGRSFFREEALREDLHELESEYTQIYTLYTLPIKKLLMTRLGDRRELSYEEFQAIFLKWEGVGTYANRADEIEKAKTDAQRVWNVLRTKQYLQDAPLYALSSLETRFKDTLRNYTAFIPDIVRVLSRHFAHGLGETAFDFESYGIDANGNHRHFYAGFDRYELDYRNGTNQIHNVKIDSITTSKPEELFPIHHDAQGNVVQAMHRGIQQIAYDSTSQRTTRILLTDGRSLKFSYDGKGERVLKRVLSADGEVSKETYYIRDEQGRVLVDYQVSYKEQELSDSLITVYLHGPQGLLGFIRDNAYYSVITDHEGSIRLVVKDGHVEAAYDYLPYGQLMRTYGNNPDAHITYRYTGQEWDAETGLYNYHARLYDPSIGRFYQVDPKEQYFSPYKYAGNSPVSLVDPDGELAVTAVILIGASIATALGGTYLGGAAANNRWNPADWDWKHKSTYAGMGIGGVAGTFIPVGFVASAGSIGIVPTVLLGTGGVYLSTAASNRNWNPAEWEWSRPHTWNAAFQGFGAGSGVAGGIGGLKSLYTDLSATGKGVLIGSSSVSAVGLAYGGGVLTNQGNAAFWEWNWEEPATWEAILGGGLGGAMLPAAALKSGQFLKGNLGKLGKNVHAFGQAIKAWKRISKGNLNTLWQDLHSFGRSMNEVNLLQVLRANARIAGGIGVAGGMTYLQLPGSWDEIDMTNLASYQIIFNGILSLDTLSIEKKRSEKNNFSKKSRRCRRTTAGSCSYTEAERKMQKASKQAVEEVKAHLEKSSKSQEAVSSANSKLHTTVSAVMTDDLIVVGFSGLEKHEGALFYFQASDQTLITKKYAPTNRIGYQEGDYPAKFHKDPTINVNLVKPVLEMKKNIKNLNNKLMSKGLNLQESRALIQAYQEAKQLYAEYMRKFNNMGQVKHRLDSAIKYEKDSKKMLGDLTKEINKLENEIKQFKEENPIFKEKEKLLKEKNKKKKKLKLSLPILKAFIDRTDSFLNQKKPLVEMLQGDNKITTGERKKVKLLKTINDRTIESILTDGDIKSLWKNLPQARATCSWLIENCGEPHALTGLIKRLTILESDSASKVAPWVSGSPWKTVFDKGDQRIQFMGAYDTKTLEAKERCAQCKITTRYTEYVFTDIDDFWESISNRLFSKMLDKVGDLSDIDLDIDAILTRNKRSLSLPRLSIAETKPREFAQLEASTFLSSSQATVNNHPPQTTMPLISSKQTKTHTQTTVSSCQIEVPEGYTVFKWLCGLFGKRSFVNELNKVEKISQIETAVNSLDEIEATLNQSLVTYGDKPFISQKRSNFSNKNPVSTRNNPLLFFKERSTQSTNRVYPVENKNFLLGGR